MTQFKKVVSTCDPLTLFVKCKVCGAQTYGSLKNGQCKSDLWLCLGGHIQPEPRPSLLSGNLKNNICVQGLGLVPFVDNKVNRVVEANVPCTLFVFYLYCLEVQVL